MRRWVQLVLQYHLLRVNQKEDYSLDIRKEKKKSYQQMKSINGSMKFCVTMLQSEFKKIKIKW